MTAIFLITFAATMLGLVFGSFSGATVWRLRAKQLVADKQAGDDYDKAELRRMKPLADAKLSEDRSRCLHCGHGLAWFDLLPLVSWVSTKGTCRYCKKAIGRFEPLIELGTAAIFGLFTYVWVTSHGVQLLGLGLLAVWLVAITMFVILFAYDQKWFILPDVVMIPLIVLSVVISFATYKAFVRPPDLAGYLLSVGASVMILSGLYLALWLYSKGRWVGFGDVKLGIALGLLLIDWKLALLTLFLANLLGTLIVLPGLLSGKLSRQTQVPFGPFLIVAFFISLLFGHGLLNAYDSVSTWLSSALLML